jgi:PAS domain S-box-containing protein
MRARFQHFFAPPVLSDEDQSRTAALLNTMLWASLAVALIDALSQLLRDVTEASVWLVLAGLILLLSLLLLLLRRGATRPVSVLFCVAAFTVLLASTYAFGGVRSASYSALILAILLAGILLGGRAALVLTGLSIGLGWLLLQAELQRQYVPDIRYLFPFDVWLGQAFIFVLAALLLTLTNRSLRRALTEAHDSRAALQQRTLELEQERSALRASEERYRNFIEQSMEGIWLVEFDQPIPIDLPPLEQVHLIQHSGYVAECNQALAEMYGYERRELVGKRLLDLYGGSIRDENVQATRMLVESGYRSANRETVEVNRQGEAVYLLNNAVGSIRDGRLTAVWGTQRDVTDRKRFEQMLTRRARQAQTAAQVLRAVASILDLDQLLPRIVEVLQQGFDLYYAGLYLTDEAGQWAVLRAATGEPGRQLRQDSRPLAVDAASLIGWSILHREARLALEAGEQPPLQPAVRSEIVLPLVNWAGAIGAITLQSDRPHDFTPDDVPVLQTMADQVAIAIGNARLFEIERRHTALMAALRDIGLDLSAQLDLPALLKIIVQRAAQLLDAPMGDLLLIEPDGQALKEVANYQSPPEDQIFTLRLGEGVSGRVALTGEPLIIDDYLNWPERIRAIDAAGYRSVLGVPIKWQDQVLGVINLQDSRPGVFTMEHVNRLQLFAVQAAVAIENARLFEATRRNLTELKLVHAVAVAAASATDEEELIQEVMQAIGAALAPDFFGVLLTDESIGALRLTVYHTGVGLFKRPQTIPLGTGITGTVAVTGQPFRTNDVRTVPAYQLVNPETRSELCVSMKAGEQILGVINMESRQLAAFSEADEQLMDTVAGQLATAIDRLRAEAARRQNEEELAQERNRLRSLNDELAAKNAELERFTYTVSHDLKSPLITIRGFMGFLEKDAETGNLDRLRDDLARITQATDKMQRMLNELLELSRVGRMMNAPQRVSLDSIAREAVLLVEGRLNARGVKVSVAPNLPEVWVDRARLVEVLQNLIDNAVKFMGRQAEPRIEIGRRDAEDLPVFFVRDNGMGIDPRYHDRVFGLFDKLDPKSEGIGVGLALVKRIIEVHGGRIWVESDGPGHGATFCFTLPTPGQGVG